MHDYFLVLDVGGRLHVAALAVGRVLDISGRRVRFVDDLILLRPLPLVRHPAGLRTLLIKVAHTQLK